MIFFKFSNWEIRDEKKDPEASFWILLYKDFTLQSLHRLHADDELEWK
jgi:hypothetical protein